MKKQKAKVVWRLFVCLCLRNFCWKHARGCQKFISHVGFPHPCVYIEHLASTQMIYRLFFFVYSQEQDFLFSNPCVDEKSTTVLKLLMLTASLIVSFYVNCWFGTSNLFEKVTIDFLVYRIVQVGICFLSRKMITNTSFVISSLVYTLALLHSHTREHNVMHCRQFYLRSLLPNKTLFSLCVFLSLHMIYLVFFKITTHNKNKILKYWKGIKSFTFV